ncbi:MAG: putative methicillin resistance protein [Acidobacteriaceae bacterium]|nr:putative methicillin resistance protein [Acidobacteriaceae bacterium]
MLTKASKSPSKLGAQESFTLRYIEPGEYPLWDALVQSSPQGSVFGRSWWLNAVGNVRVLALFSRSEMIAGIPLYFETHFGIPVCTMPKLTQTWGIIMPPLEGKRVTATARETKILRAFAIALSRYKLFFQAFHPSLSNWLPFYWSGFRQTTRFTYVIDDLTDLNRVWNGISDKTRCEITKAQRAGLTVVPCAIEDVHRCECQSFLRQGRRPSHSESLLNGIHDSAKENDSGACFAVVDQKGTVHSACLLVWDRHRAYYLVGGAVSGLRTSGANSLGVWSAIQFVAQRSRAFDFAGSVIQSIEHFNRNFGAKQVPYNYVIKVPTLVQSCLQFAGKL